MEWYPGKPGIKPQDPFARIEARSIPEPNTGCVYWMGAVTAGGYAKISVNGKEQYVHRLVWEREHGPIPDGLVIDHKCRVRCCVNPQHLEPVTDAVNLARGIVRERVKAMHAARTHCWRGHPFDEDNTYRTAKGRHCKACQRINEKTYRNRKTG